MLASSTLPFGAAPDVETWLRGEAVAFALETARVAGVVVSSPVPWRDAPRKVKAALVLMLTIVSHGHSGLPAVALESVDRLVLSGVSELLIGVAMGIVVLLLLSIADIAADAIGPIMGFGMAQVLDPASGRQITVLGRLFSTFALLLALAAGLHRVLISALVSSFRALPAGSLVDPSDAFPPLWQLSALVLETGVLLALPTLAVLFMVQLALGFVSRAAPAMQIFSVGFAVTLAAGAGVLILGAPDLAGGLLARFSHAGAHLEQVLAALRP